MRQEYHEQSQSRACFLFAVVSFSHRTTSSNWSCGCLCAVLYFCFLSSRRRRRRHRHRFSLRCWCWSERIFFPNRVLEKYTPSSSSFVFMLSSLSRSARPDYIFTVVAGRCCFCCCWCCPRLLYAYILIMRPARIALDSQLFGRRTIKWSASDVEWRKKRHNTNVAAATSKFTSLNVPKNDGKKEIVLTWSAHCERERESE